MKPIAWAGVDPGKTGAFVVIHDGGHLVADWPGDPAGAVEILRGWLDRFEIRLVALEKVGARPGQGVSSMFAFGRNLGAWEGIFAGLRIPYVMPTPQQWQKGLVTPSDGEDAKGLPPSWPAGDLLFDCLFLKTWRNSNALPAYFLLNKIHISASICSTENPSTWRNSELLRHLFGVN